MRTAMGSRVLGWVRGAVGLVASARWDAAPRRARRPGRPERPRTISLNRAYIVSRDSGERHGHRLEHHGGPRRARTQGMCEPHGRAQRRLHQGVRRLAGDQRDRRLRHARRSRSTKRIQARRRTRRTCRCSARRQMLAHHQRGRATRSPSSTPRPTSRSSASPASTRRTSCASRPTASTPTSPTSARTTSRASTSSTLDDRRQDRARRLRRAAQPDVAPDEGGFADVQIDHERHALRRARRRPAACSCTTPRPQHEAARAHRSASSRGSCTPSTRSPTCRAARGAELRRRDGVADSTGQRARMVRQRCRGRPGVVRRQLLAARSRAGVRDEPHRSEIAVVDTDQGQIVEDASTWAATPRPRRRRADGKYIVAAVSSANRVVVIDAVTNEHREDVRQHRPATRGASRFRSARTTATEDVEVRMSRGPRALGGARRPGVPRARAPGAKRRASRHQSA